MYVRLRLMLSAVAALSLSSAPLPRASAVDVFVSSAAGHPYAVASIEIPVDPPSVGQPLPGLSVADDQQRVLYPIASDLRVDVGRPSDRPVPPPGGGRLLSRVGNLIRELTDGERELPQQTVARRITFLVRGSEPLRVRLADHRGEIGQYEIVFDADAAAGQQLLADWWKAFTAQARQQIDHAQYPPWVESYLVAMLSGRLSLPLPQWYTAESNDGDQLLSTLQLIAGAGPVARSIFTRAAIGRGDVDLAATLPLPAPPQWSPLWSSLDQQQVEVEPLATRVPPECFYVRYGSFENYLWFLNLSEEYGGDVSRMFSLRGLNDNAASRIEEQLNLKTSELSRMLGSTVVDDQALIGRDAFLADGASIGVLFKTKNVFLMRTSLHSERAQLAKNDPAVRLKDIKIGDRTVSLLASADNRVRSFLVEDGPYILVTNSKTLARRFMEVSQGESSLATTASFQLARRLMPLSREDTIFAYFSPEMLRGLVSPEYLIELRRRLYAKSDIALVHLARLAAAAEGNATTSIDGLIEAGYLPIGFGSRADGSSVIGVGDQVLDTLRGMRGGFLPIADAEIESVTAEEAAWYNGIAAEYSSRFPTIDPIMVGLQRSDPDPATGVERVTVHAEVAPWGPEKYGWVAQQLGPPTNVAIDFAPDDIIAVQAHVVSPQLGPPTHLFAAIKDTFPPDPDDFDGILKIYFSLRGIPGYLGAWPQPGALDRLPLGLGRGQPVGPGMSRLIGGLYRYTGGGFSILSFQQEVLLASLPFLGAGDVEDEAQIRGHVGNLHGSQIEGWANAQLYQLAAEGSQGGADLLRMISQQLHVQPDQVPAAAAGVFGADIQCTLGGDYQYSLPSGHWTSTAWQGPSLPPVPPPGYQAPVLEWFRGASANVTQYHDRLIADAVIDIQRKQAN